LSKVSGRRRVRSIDEAARRHWGALQGKRRKPAPQRRRTLLTRSDAYVLVQTDGHTDPIARSLINLPGVVAAEDVRGPYDAVVMVHPDGAVDNVESIVAEIRALPGVIHALAAPLAAIREIVRVPELAEVPSLTAAAA